MLKEGVVLYGIHREGGVGLEVAMRPVRDVVKLENGLSIKDLKNLKNNILKAQMASLKEEKEKKLKVAAYCRVSTLQEEQEELSDFIIRESAVRKATPSFGSKPVACVETKKDSLWHAQQSKSSLQFSAGVFKTFTFLINVFPPEKQPKSHDSLNTDSCPEI